MSSRKWPVALIAISLALAACGGGETTSTPVTEAPGGSAPDTGGGGVQLTVVGENIAFDTTTLTAPAGEEVTITFENRDSGVQHNLQIEGPSGPIATEIEAGPVTQTLTFTIDEPGTYRFVCVVHPARMVGDLVIDG